MADAYIGEIRIFAGNYAPNRWALCNGQLMSIGQNTALYSLLGTMYGGDGKTTFALPNLMGAAPMGHGTGNGLTEREIGTKVGAATVTLLQTQMPAHRHIPKANDKFETTGASYDPTNGVWAVSNSSGRPPEPSSLYDGNKGAVMSSSALSVTGGSGPHNNMQPYLALNYIICLQGEYPPRS